jgi:hypothetical protein
MRNEVDLRAVWRNQAVAALRLSDDDIRARAEYVERQTRWRYLRDQASLGTIALAFAVGVVVLDGYLTRIGCALLFLWAAYGIFGLRRFGSALRIPADAVAATCALYHRRQLERQRDIALSWPLGVGLAAPRLLLYVVGSVVGPRQFPWQGGVALVGLFAFAYVAAVIHGKMLAAQWQREIDALVVMSSEEAL